MNAYGAEIFVEDIQHDPARPVLRVPPVEPFPALVIDQATGPRTIVGPGEHCLLCEDPMERGEVYLFVRDLTNRYGIAHESCIDEHAEAGPDLEGH